MIIASVYGVVMPPMHAAMNEVSNILKGLMCFFTHLGEDAFFLVNKLLFQKFC